MTVMRFVIVDDLPYLYRDGETFAVRWDEQGFTVGGKVKLAKVPEVTCSELSVKAKCKVLNSFPAKQEEAVEQAEPKKAARTRRRVAKE